VWAQLNETRGRESLNSSPGDSFHQVRKDETVHVEQIVERRGESEHEHADLVIGSNTSPTRKLTRITSVLIGSEVSSSSRLITTPPGGVPRVTRRGTADTGRATELSLLPQDSVEHNE